MERLTPQRAKRTWRLFHISWYINLVCFGIVLACVGYFFGDMNNYSAARGLATMDAVYLIVDVEYILGLGIIACIFLLGAGISRYQARVEGQHFELKQTLNHILERLEELENSRGHEEEIEHVPGEEIEEEKAGAETEEPEPETAPSPPEPASPETNSDDERENE